MTMLTTTLGARARWVVLAALFTLTLGAAPMAAAADGHALAELTWLLGHWQAETGDRVIREYWAPVTTETWEGFGDTRTRVAGGALGELIESESLRLVQMESEVFYLAKVAHNPRPIAFALTECGPGLAVFENPEHDFPRRIAYRLAGEALTVEVTDGQAGGKGFTLQFQRHD